MFNEEFNPGEWDTQSFLGFWDPKRSSNLGQTITPSDNKQKKKKREPAE